MASEDQSLVVQTKIAALSPSAKFEFARMTTRRGMTTRGHNRLNSSSAATGADETGALIERGEGSAEIDTLRRDLEISERENNRVR